MEITKTIFYVILAVAMISVVAPHLTGINDDSANNLQKYFENLDDLYSLVHIVIAACLNRNPKQSVNPKYTRKRDFARILSANYIEYKNLDDRCPKTVNGNYDLSLKDLVTILNNRYYARNGQTRKIDKRPLIINCEFSNSLRRIRKFNGTMEFLEGMTLFLSLIIGVVVFGNGSITDFNNCLLGIMLVQMLFLLGSVFGNYMFARSYQNTSKAVYIASSLTQDKAIQNLIKLANEIDNLCDDIDYQKTYAYKNVCFTGWKQLDSLKKDNSKLLNDIYSLIFLDVAYLTRCNSCECKTNVQLFSQKFRVKLVDQNLQVNNLLTVLQNQKLFKDLFNDFDKESVEILQSIHQKFSVVDDLFVKQFEHELSSYNATFNKNKNTKNSSKDQFLQEEKAYKLIAENKIG